MTSHTQTTPDTPTAPSRSPLTFGRAIGAFLVVAVMYWFAMWSTLFVGGPASWWLAAIVVLATSPVAGFILRRWWAFLAPLPAIAALAVIIWAFATSGPLVVF